MKRQVMKTYTVVEVQLHAFLTWALLWGKKSASYPVPPTPGTHWKRSWVELWLQSSISSCEECQLYFSFIPRVNPYYALYFCLERKPDNNGKLNHWYQHSTQNNRNLKRGNSQIWAIQINFYGSLWKSNIRNLNYISLSHQAIFPISLWEKLHTIDKTQSYTIWHN
jgi:hypothetical protein